VIGCILRVPGKQTWRLSISKSNTVTARPHRDGPAGHNKSQ